ncbi:hypothetical protein [Niallia sp. RD1]|uniref:hypothetical protein n=1 Tax=Niallia sp. RD1 TaxID=2962858 RepID=UPI0020C19CA1|nr:hypothetical protein [Niallia sp. RD1]UTI41075.1 hypothetical protein NKG37_19760 [Niallia sp. RD1]
MLAERKEIETYIEEPQQDTHILLDHNHKLWPVYFWVVASVIGILLGVGVVNG